jgi:hypothetical protein
MSNFEGGTFFRNVKENLLELLDSYKQKPRSSGGTIGYIVICKDIRVDAYLELLGGTH